MTRIIPIPQCYVGYFLWIVVFICNAYSIYWFATNPNNGSIDPLLRAAFFVVSCIFGTAGNAIFTGLAIQSLNKRYGFIRWYGIGFKLVPCDEPRTSFNHQHEWDFGTIVDGNVICKNFKCVEKRKLTPEELEQYQRNN